MKRFTLLALILIIAAVFVAACAAPAPSTPAAQVTSAPAAQPTSAPAAQPTAAPSGQARTLHILGNASGVPGLDDAYKQTFADFEKEFNVKVDARLEGDWSALPERLQTARVGNEPVDIVFAGANTINSTYARAGAVMDLTELIKPFQDRFNPGMLDPYTIGGHLWAVPQSTVSTSAIYYNASMFKELGIEEPKTYADLVAAAKIIKEKKGIDPMIHQGKATFMWPMWFFETYAQTSQNQSVEKLQEALQGKRKFTDPEVVAAFAALAKFSKDGILNSDSLGTDNAGMIAAFAQQKAAMFYGGTWEVATIRDTVKDFDVGVFPFPNVTDDPKILSQHGGGPDTGYAIPSFEDPKNLDLAVQFLEFITRPANANKVLSLQAPFYASQKGVTLTKDPLTDDLVKNFYPNTIRFLDWIWPAEVNDAMQGSIAGVISGSMTPEQAAQNVQDAYDKVVKEKDYSYDWWSKWTDADWKKVTPASIPQITVGQ
jgi:raffinose/stachyose/melibiose transport system substrate-binding protein